MLVQYQQRVISDIYLRTFDLLATRHLRRPFACKDTIFLILYPTTPIGEQALLRTVVLARDSGSTFQFVSHWTLENGTMSHSAALDATD